MNREPCSTMSMTCWKTVALTAAATLLIAHGGALTNLVFRLNKPSTNQKRRYKAATDEANEQESIDAIVARLKAEFKVHKTCKVKSPVNGKWDAEWREQQIYGIHDMLQENAKEFYEAAYADLGKPYAEFILELNVILADIRCMIKNIRTWMQPEAVKTPLFLKPAHSYIHYEPHGVALILGPWNFPLNLVIMPVCAALAAGNACLIKPSESAPAQAALFKKYFPKYVDPKAVVVITGGPDVSKKAVDADIDYCFFTGGAQVGSLVAASCAPRQIGYTLELGGKSPVVIDRDCDFEVMVRRVVHGKVMNGGQVCLSPDYLVIIGDESRAREVIFKGIIPEFQRQCEDALQHPDYIARLVNLTRFNKLMGMLTEANDYIVSGGKSDPGKLLIEPTVLYMNDRDAAEKLQIFQEEIFGPLLPVVNVPTVEDAVEFISKRPNPLAVYVFSQNQRTIDTIFDQVNAGTACVNDTLCQASTPFLPFGGTRQSGVGRYHGRSGFLQLSNAKSILVRSEHPDSPMKYYPALREEKTQQLISWAMSWLL